MEEFILRLVMYIGRGIVLIPKKVPYGLNYMPKLNKYRNPKANVYTSLKSLIFLKIHSQEFIIVSLFVHLFTLKASVPDQQS